MIKNLHHVQDQDQETGAQNSKEGERRCPSFCARLDTLTKLKICCSYDEGKRRKRTRLKLEGCLGNKNHFQRETTLFAQTQNGEVDFNQSTNWQERENESSKTPDIRKGFKMLF